MAGQGEGRHSLGAAYLPLDGPEAVANFHRQNVNTTALDRVPVEGSRAFGPGPAHPLSGRPRRAVSTSPRRTWTPPPCQPTAVVMTALPEPVRPRTVSLASLLGGVFDTSSSLRA
jgi:hypothetical protein